MRGQKVANHHGMSRLVKRLLDGRVCLGVVRVLGIAMCLCCLVAAPAIAAPVLLHYEQFPPVPTTQPITTIPGGTITYAAPAGNNRMLVVTMGTDAAGASAPPNLADCPSLSYTVDSGAALTVNRTAGYTTNFALTSTTNRVGAHVFSIWMGDSATSQSVVFTNPLLRAQVWHFATFGNMANAAARSSNGYSVSSATTSVLYTNAITTPANSECLVVVQSASGRYINASDKILPNTPTPASYHGNLMNYVIASPASNNRGPELFSWYVQSNPAGTSVSYQNTCSGTGMWVSYGASYQTGYRVAATAGTDGTLPGWTDGDYNLDASVSVTALANPGYAFSKWQMNDAAQGAADNWVDLTALSAGTTCTFKAGRKFDQTTSLDRNGHALRALFTQNTGHTVTFDPSGGSVSPTSKTVLENGLYGPLPAATLAGFNFLGWFDTPVSGGMEVTASTVVTISSDQTLYARWVTPVPVTVTAAAQTKVYGEADPVLTYTVAPPLDPGDVMSGALTRAVGTPVGAHAILQGTLAAPPRYTVTFVGAALTITPKPLTVTADAKSKVYGSTDPALTCQTVAGALVPGDALSGAPVRAAGETVPDGPYSVTQGSVSAGPNYTIAFVGANLTITPKPLTVTADAKTKTYGDADPPLTCQTPAGSLMGGDLLGGVPTRAAGEMVLGGPYAITQGTVDAGPNYTITYVGASLTITPRPLTVSAEPQTKLYGDADPPLTYQISSGTLYPGDTLTGALARAAGETVGTYAIHQGTLTGAPNYSILYEGTDLTVSKATATVALGSLAQMCDGTARSATATTLPPGLIVDFTYDGSATPPTGTGSYAVAGTIADFNYQGSAAGTLVVSDAVPPVITLLGANPATVECDTSYTDAGATALDACVGDRTDNIVVTNLVNTAVLGVQTVRYNVGDGHGNSAVEVTRAVNVVDTTAPVMGLVGAAVISVECGTAYADAGAASTDACAGDLYIEVGGETVNPAVPGSYTIAYSAYDGSGNRAAQITRTVSVVDTVPPVITLLGTSPVIVECNTSYTDAGATANDSCAGELAGGVSITNPVNPDVPGTYIVRYNLGNGGDVAEVTRTVTVVDTTLPVIGLVGPAVVTVEYGGAYTDAGATASDSCAGDITNRIVTVNPVDPWVRGTYKVRYNVSDGNGNSAVQVTRTVTVAGPSPYLQGNYWDSLQALAADMPSVLDETMNTLEGCSLWTTDCNSQTALYRQIIGQDGPNWIGSDHGASGAPGWAYAPTGVPDSQRFALLEAVLNPAPLRRGLSADTIENIRETFAANLAKPMPEMTVNNITWHIDYFSYNGTSPPITMNNMDLTGLTIATGQANSLLGFELNVPSMAWFFNNANPRLDDALANLTAAYATMGDSRGAAYWYSFMGRMGEVLLAERILPAVFGNSLGAPGTKSIPVQAAGPNPLVSSDTRTGLAQRAPVQADKLSASCGPWSMANDLIVYVHVNNSEGQFEGYVKVYRGELCAAVTAWASNYQLGPGKYTGLPQLLGSGSSGADAGDLNGDGTTNLSSHQAAGGGTAGFLVNESAVLDFTPPEITLLGDAVITLECPAVYDADAGATAYDGSDGDLSARISRTGLEPSAAPLGVGAHYVHYDVNDSDHNAATRVTRTVNVVDTMRPVIGLVGSPAITIERGQAYEHAGATASDACAGDLTDSIVTVNPVNTAVVGVYTVTYNVDDGHGNSAVEVMRTVTVGRNVFRVNALNTAGPWDGKTWAAAFRDIQSAVDAATMVGGEVWVAAGTYTGAVNPVVTMKPGVFLYGGFAGTESRSADRNWLANISAIDGEDARRCVIGASNAALDGFTVTRGRSVNGGGMYNNVPLLTVANCTFTGNRATYSSTTYGGGGAMYNDASSPTVTNCVFTRNTATKCAGALFNGFYSAPVVMNCTFTLNTAALGGAVFNYRYASPALTNCILWGDTATTGPEILDYSASAPVVIWCCVQGGYAGAGNISADPLFVDAVAGNLLLQACVSPCIDKGTAAGAPGSDMRGITRPQGGGVDMGAYETVANDTVPPVIALNGPSQTSAECGVTCTDAGATATDACAGDRTASIVVTNPVNTAVPGVYTVRYNVNDGNGNSAVEVTRAVNVVDTTAPVMELLGAAAISVECGASYTDAGAASTDACAGDLPVEVGGDTVNPAAPGSYTIAYSADDGSGNRAEATRVVTVADTTAPVVQLVGDSAVTVECGSVYADAGATAADTCAGDLAAGIVVSNPVNTSVLGTHIVSYDANDGSGNGAAEITRTVTVADTTPPVITLNGVFAVTVRCNAGYTDAGATATDNCAGDLTASIVTVNPVNAAVVGVYTVTYNLGDGNGNNAAEVTRTVTVSGPTPTIPGVPHAPITVCDTGDGYPPATPYGAPVTYTGPKPTGAGSIPIFSLMGPNESVTGPVYDTPITSWPADGANDFCAAFDTVACSLDALAGFSPEIPSYAALYACSTDINGPINQGTPVGTSSFTPNGIPDGEFELGLLAAVLNNTNTLDAAKVGATNAQIITAYRDNFFFFKKLVTEGLSKVPLNKPPNPPTDLRGQFPGLVPWYPGALVTILAGYATEGDPQSLSALNALLVQMPLISSGLQPPAGGVEGHTTGFASILGPDGDADGDGLTNRQEYDRYKPRGAAATIAAQLGAVIPPGPHITACAANQTVPADASCAALVPDFTAAVVTTGDAGTILTLTQSPEVGTSVVRGDTTVTVTVTDDAGNSAACTAVLTVADATAPVITLNGPAEMTLEQGAPYTDEGATATDNCAGDLTASIVTVNQVNTAVAGMHWVMYNVSDGNGNIAEVWRAVTVTSTGPTPTIPGVPHVPVPVVDGVIQCPSDDGSTYPPSTPYGAPVTYMGTKPMYAGSIPIFSLVGPNEAVTGPVYDTPITSWPADGANDFCAAFDTMACSLEALSGFSTEITSYAAFCACSTDINGPFNPSPPVGERHFSPNGIPDGEFELGLLAAILNNIHALDAAKVGATNAQIIRAYRNNFFFFKKLVAEAFSKAQLNTPPKPPTDLRGLFPGLIPWYPGALATILAGYATEGDPQSLSALNALLLQEPFVPSGFQPSEGGVEGNTIGFASILGPDGDADGDGFTNRQEYDHFKSQGAAATIAAQLDAAITPPTCPAPVITLNGSSAFTVECGASYTDAGATASAACAGDLTASITTVNPVNAAVAGVYTVTYNVSDGANSAAEVTRTVTVADTTPPVITLLGSSPVSVEFGSVYTDAGATATDMCAGDRTGSISVTNPVNTTVSGAYTVTYDVNDGNGNAGTQVTRTVVVGATPDCASSELNWAWMGGASTANSLGTYGTMGMAAAANNPGARNRFAFQADASGVFWLFGGSYTDKGFPPTTYNRNDVWQYNPSTGNWTWMKGASTADQSGTYGTLGTPAVANTPGARRNASSWTDASGNQWLFGGSNGSYFNDLWKYTAATGNWTWMKGASTTGQVGTYGTMGTPAAACTPGARYAAVTWTDASGKLWLFGGYGFSTGSASYLNDLWKYDPATGNWTWMNGASAINQLGTYGTLGTPATANTPGARSGMVAWTDAAGAMWLFGGYGYGASGSVGYLNDLWKYDPATGTWTWMKGASATGQAGTYGTLGTPATNNTPGARQDAGSWTEASGMLWLFGGYNGGDLNDLWKYDPASGNWIWMKGTATTNHGGTYGTLGAPAPANTPGTRLGPASWTDGLGALWLFGGVGYDGAGTRGSLNDLWRLNTGSVDSTSPVITLLGADPVSVECGGTYIDAGATAMDNCAGDLTGAIVTVNPVDTHVPGIYTLTYNVGDGNGNSALGVTRTVTVSGVDTIPPVITLNGSASATAQCGTVYADAGATVTDICATGLAVSVGGDTVNTAVIGTYTLTYNANDGNGNSAAEVVRTVAVVDTLPPVITRLGSNPVSILVGTPYTDAGVTAADDCAGGLNGSVETVNPVNTAVLGAYTVTYDVNDGHGDSAAQVTRLVVVRSDLIHRVNLESTVTPRDGSSWDKGYLTIQEAVDAASSAAGSEVWVKAGTYTAATDPVLTMRPVVAIYGGFAGTETSFGERKPSVYVTTIDGLDTSRCVVGANSATLDGFTVSHGSAVNGGGMYNESCSPTVTGCTFTENRASSTVDTVHSNGGGMCNADASPAVTNCIFDQNVAHSSGKRSAYSYGGGMCNTGASSPTVANCVFVRNEASSSSVDSNARSYGGGMCNSDSSGPTTTNCTFTNNSATAFSALGSANAYGGGVYCNTALPVLTNCIFWGDTAMASGSELGGGLPTVSYSCVQGGYAGTGNINADPLFVAAPDNLRLQAGSPCIDTGTATGTPATDIEGTLRPQGAGNDMGAYERDATPPVITVCAVNRTVSANGYCQALVPDFTAEVVATDNFDTSLTVTQLPAVGSAVGMGNTTVTLAVTDDMGNFAPCTAVLTVTDGIAPVIALNSSAAVSVECGTVYTDAGATASDACAGDLTAGIVVTNPVSVNAPGTYTVTYNVADGNGNSAIEVTRTVSVVDTSVPVITLLGANPVTVECGSSHIDAGATASDACAGDLTASIVTVNPVNTAVVGVYTVTYNVSDGVNSAAEVTRVVSVLQTDVTAPTITKCASNRTMASDASCSVVVPDLTTEVTATDDTTPSGSLVITQSPLAGSVVTGLGAHMVTITVTDAFDNAQTCTASLTLTAFAEGGTSPTVLPWATDGTVTAMAATADTLFIGGSFTWAGAAGGTGTGWTNLAAVTLATGAVQAWTPVTTGAVTALALSADGATLYAGGNGFVDEVDVATGASVPLATMTGPVAGLAVADGLLYVGGDFTQAPDPNYYLGAIDLATGGLTGWTAAVAGPVLSLAVSGTTLYAGGANGIETVDLTTGTVAAFSAADGSVNSLWASCETVYAGGLFGTIGGQARDYVAALDAADGTAKAGWAPAANGAVRAIAVTPSSLYAAGDFTAIDGYGFAGLVKFTNTAAPTVTVNQAAGQADPATAYPINFTVVFSEAVTGFDATDVTFGGTASGVVFGVNGSGKNYTIGVTASNNQGTLVPSIAAGRCISADGVYNAASTSTDNSVTVSVRSITVTAPTVGLIWGQGETKAIAWTNTGTMTGNVAVYLAKPGVADKWVGQTTVAAGTLSYLMPLNQTPGTDYSVKVLWATNNAVCGASAAFTVEARTYFTCTYPAVAGETWMQGESKTVTWTQTGQTGNVAVYLVKDGQADRWLAQGPFSALQLAVTLPFTVATGSGYKVKLVSASNAAITAVGANSFSVTQGVPFEVTYPATDGVVWPQSEVRTVTWVNHGLTGAVAIYLSKTGQADRWIAQPLATAQSVDVRLPFTGLAAGSGYTVKMVYVTNGALTAVGTNTITVETRSAVTVNFPAGGTNQAFILGSTLRVSWLSTSLTGGNMAVYLTKPGMADRWIGQPLATAGWLDAVIPANLVGGPGNDYKAKVVYTLNNAWTSSSASTFCILATPAVSAPAAGESWVTPSTGHAVTWNMTSLPGNIAVYLTKPGMADRWVGQTLASAGTVNVNVPSGLTAGNDYAIKVLWANNNAINASSGAIQITP